MEIIIVAVITALASIITTIINRYTSKKPIIKAINRIANGLNIGLENDRVIFRALRDHEINGASEVQEQKMEEYFKQCTIKGFEIK